MNFERKTRVNIENQTARKKYVKLSVFLKYSEKLYQINKTKNDEKRQSGKSYFIKFQVFSQFNHK